MQLSESEGSDDDNVMNANNSGKKDDSSAKKYVPPRIAPMHYGRKWLSPLNLTPLFSKSVSMKLYLVF